MVFLLDDTLQISTTDLKKLGFLNPYCAKSGTVSWGNGRSSISVTTDTNPANPYMELDYTTGGKSYNSRISLEAVPSNLGHGVIWYFRCPVSGKRCRRLYLVSSQFVHREAFAGCMYQSQIETKKYRNMVRVIEPVFSLDRIEEETYKPYYKKYYRGRPTRRYQRVLRAEEKALKVSREDVDELFRKMR